MQDWAEVQRLFHREHWSNTAIAEKLGMSRDTLSSLLERDEPPRYERESAGSIHAEPIAAMLDADPKVPAAFLRGRRIPSELVMSFSTV